MRAYEEWVRTGAARDLDGEPVCTGCGDVDQPPRLSFGGTKCGERILPRVYLCESCIGLIGDFASSLRT